MEKIRDIFVVLTYINAEDLADFIASVREKAVDSKIIVVNSYHDDISTQTIKMIAQNENCDFMNVPNKGYSFGNNQGIKYAYENYDFDFLTISNPDIIIHKYDTTRLIDEAAIYCGVLVNKKRKNQNPMLAKENKISDYLIYKGYQKQSKILLFWGLGLNKIIREVFLLFHRNRGKAVRVFQPHGSFITFSRKAIELLDQVFDENVFLFGEEGILAKRAKKLGLSIWYSDYAVCLHKEDGSMKLSDRKIDDEYGKSMKYYYDNYVKR